MSAAPTDTVTVASPSGGCTSGASSDTTTSSLHVAARNPPGPPPPLRREVGDGAGEAVARYNSAMIDRGQGALSRAVGEFDQVVELDRQVQHPVLALDTSMLERVRQEQADSGSSP